MRFDGVSIAKFIIVSGAGVLGTGGQNELGPLNVLLFLLLLITIRGCVNPDTALPTIGRLGRSWRRLASPVGRAADSAAIHVGNGSWSHALPVTGTSARNAAGVDILW